MAGGQALTVQAVQFRADRTASVGYLKEGPNVNRINRLADAKNF
jgi:hypothetical protein